MAGSGRGRDLALDDPEAVGYLERSLAGSPVWQMGTRTLAPQIQRRDPRLLDFMANAKNAPLGELEFDVLTWAITRWYQVGRPVDGRLSATLGELAQALYGARHGGMQYALVREALDHLYNVSLDLTVLTVDGEDERWRASKRRRIIQELTIHEPVTGAAAGRQSGTLEIRLGSWLVDQLDAQTVAAIAWHVLRGLGGIAKRLAIYLAAHTSEFEAITQHTERLAITLTDELYEEFGITAARERDRRASLIRAAERIAEKDPRYSRLAVHRTRAGYELRVDRPSLGGVLMLPGLGG
ncbi:MAG: replication initiator protein A [Solirubrobacterales bacterium]|nr:replication initiator protein A [Solirubrobacterales bacterium]